MSNLSMSPKIIMNNNESIVTKITNKHKYSYSQRKEFIETQKIENSNNDAVKKLN